MNSSEAEKIIHKKIIIISNISRNFINSHLHVCLRIQIYIWEKRKKDILTKIIELTKEKNKDCQSIKILFKITWIPNLRLNKDISIIHIK